MINHQFTQQNLQQGMRQYRAKHSTTKSHETDTSRTYSAGFETLSLYFGTFSLLSNKLHLWTHS